MSTSTEGKPLQDQVILVTGAARGIGASVSKACAELGATVILLDKRVKALESVYDQIEANTATQPAIYPMDLKGATLSDYQQLAKSIQHNYGRLDALIHCAASLGQLAPADLQDTKTWLETMHVNLSAAVFLTQSCLHLLKTTHNSHILFTSDTRKQKAYWGAYGISKAGIETFAAQLADELESAANTSVSVITPEETHTELFVQAFPARDPNTLPAPEQAAKAYLAILTA